MVIVANMAKDGSVAAIGLSCIVALFLFGTGPFRRWQAKRAQAKVLLQRQRNVDALLAGRSREVVLAEAPFNYSRWPDGDNNFVIGDDREKKIIHQVSSPEEAELWILEHYLAGE